MSDFDPGTGWREIDEGEWLATSIDTPHVDLYEDGRQRRWVREEPVPPLPTEPYTVIRVEWRHGGHGFLLLSPIGWQDPDGTPMPSGLTLFQSNISSFEVLSEPRAVTAKAVLDLIENHEEASWRDVMNDAAREFGVES